MPGVVVVMLLLEKVVKGDPADDDKGVVSITG